MHPEILRELGSQRGSEMRARAHRSELARLASRARRAARRTEVFAVPPIPDYVDGSFRVDAAEEKAASGHAA